MQSDTGDRGVLTIALAPTVGADPGSRAQDPGALAAYLERVLKRHVRIVVEPSYAATVESLRAGRVDVAMVGELASLRGQEAGVSSRWWCRSRRMARRRPIRASS